MGVLKTVLTFFVDDIHQASSFRPSYPVLERVQQQQPEEPQEDDEVDDDEEDQPVNPTATTTKPVRI